VRSVLAAHGNPAQRRGSTALVCLLGLQNARDPGMDPLSDQILPTFRQPFFDPHVMDMASLPICITAISCADRNTLYVRNILLECALVNVFSKFLVDLACLLEESCQMGSSYLSSQ
jgi:hypothetical protein